MDGHAAQSPPQEFVGCPTPEAWLAAAVADSETLLLDHAHCERKAAATALALMHRYPEDLQLLEKLSRLAREELRHFEQVLKLMRARDMRYRRFAPARYFAALHALVRSHEPARCVDSLVLGAFIEARSCERFQQLGPRLPADIAAFYRGLCAAESRHFGDYLGLAARRADAAEVEARVAVFRAHEAELICAPDTVLRFHSGVPASS